MTRPFVITGASQMELVAKMKEANAAVEDCKSRINGLQKSIRSIRRFRLAGIQKERRKLHEFYMDCNDELERRLLLPQKR